MVSISKSTLIPLSQQEIADRIAQLPNWAVEEREGVKYLRREFRFADRGRAVTFSQQVETLQTDDHRPAVTVNEFRVVVEWWTPFINGLHNMDFQLAAQTNAIYEENYA